MIVQLNIIFYIISLLFSKILMPAEFHWLPSRNGQVPPGAVEGGRTNGGEVLYIGRTYHHGTPCVGKVTLL